MDDAANTLDDLRDAPDEPAVETCAELLGELGRLIAAGGWERFARPPVEPGEDAFPDPWQPTPLGVATIARRLVAHAGADELAVTIVDRRAEAGGVSKKVPTELELVSVDGRRARFDLYSIGDDEVVGTIALEVGVALAARWRAPELPYRGVAVDAIDDELRRRGGVAADYAGLGVVAANASFQEYKLGRYQAHLGYAPVDYEVVKAGELTVDEHGFLLAVQAVVRGAPPPRGLGGVQLDAVRAWMAALADRPERVDALRSVLGVPARDGWGDLARGAPAPLPPVPDDELVEPGEVALPVRRVFRVAASRTGLGVIVGMALGGAGVGVAGVLGAVPIGIATGALAGAALGSRSRFERCSSCAHAVPAGVPACPHCGGELGGVITSRADALEAD